MIHAHAKNIREQVQNDTGNRYMNAATWCSRIQSDRKKKRETQKTDRERKATEWDTKREGWYESRSGEDARKIGCMDEGEKKNRGDRRG